MLFLTLFLSGIVTILLPCILPLLPIVVGVSIAGRSRWRPLMIVAGMLAGFVGLTFLLEVFLRSFAEFADILRIATYAALLLFGAGMLTERRSLRWVAAVAGGFFFLAKGWPAVGIAVLGALAAMELGGRVAAALQRLGARLQGGARREFGDASPLTVFIVGLTLGLVWVPCAGPALGFVLALVREQPGVRALVLLTAYGAGTALPLLLVGYGGQWATGAVHALTRFSGLVKRAAGILLLATALGLQFNWFTTFQVFLAERTRYGVAATQFEERLFAGGRSAVSSDANAFDAGGRIVPSLLPRLRRAPEFESTGPWHNGPPLTLASLKGKVVLIDFWTYSCINCIRTLPYIQGYWEKYQEKPFVVIGVHTPEFLFEQSVANVRAAIARRGLTYPVVQDNDFGTWNAFANRYWPAKYLVDAQGYIRYTHFGEGAYDETDRAIASLLGEIGVDTAGMPPPPRSPEGGYRRQSPETYLGSRSWESLANAHDGPTGEKITYALPSAIALHSYALEGDWQLVDGERQVLRSATGAIVLHFLGGEANLVLGREGASPPASASVTVDGEPAASFSVDHNDLYPLFKGAYGEHTLTLLLKGDGVSGYAFTFGG